MKWSHSAYPKNPSRRAIYRFMETPHVGQIEIVRKMGFKGPYPHRSGEPLADYFKRQRRWLIFKRKVDFQKMGYYSWLWRSMAWGAPETSW